MNDHTGRRIEVGPNVIKSPLPGSGAGEASGQSDDATTKAVLLAASLVAGSLSTDHDNPPAEVEAPADTATTPPAPRPKPPRDPGESQADYETRVRFGR